MRELLCSKLISIWSGISAVLSCMSVCQSMVRCPWPLAEVFSMATPGW